MTLRFGLIAFVAAVLFMSACAGPRAAERGGEDADDLPEPVDVRLSDYEDFDVSPYRESAPEEERIEHDVPATLMEGRAGSGDARTVQGFRIQVASSVEKDEAVAAEEQLKQWWRAEGQSAARGLFPAELPTYVVYRQPYYRVRVGNFASRGDAERALGVIEAQFPGSFIVPDTVTIRGE